MSIPTNIQGFSSLIGDYQNMYTNYSWLGFREALAVKKNQRWNKSKKIKPGVVQFVMLKVWASSWGAFPIYSNHQILGAHKENEWDCGGCTNAQGCFRGSWNTHDHPLLRPRLVCISLYPLANILPSSFTFPFAYTPIFSLIENSQLLVLHVLHPLLSLLFSSLISLRCLALL